MAYISTIIVMSKLESNLCKTVCQTRAHFYSNFYGVFIVLGKYNFAYFMKVKLIKEKTTVLHWFIDLAVLT